MSTTFSKNLTLFFTLSLFSLLLLLLDHLSFLGFLREGVEKIANPIKWEISQQVRVFYQQKNSSSQDRVVLQAKIDYLEQKNAKLQVELKSLTQETEAFKKQLKLVKPAQFSLLPARNLSVIEGIMILDKGEKAGVKAGLTVVSEDILVGRVIGVTPLTSQVSLPIEQQSKIKVKILPSEEKGVLEGTAEGRLILKEVLQKARLEPEELIVASGEEGKYPSDLPIGKIEKVLKDDVQIYQEAEVRPLLDYQSLKVVIIRM